MNPADTSHIDDEADGPASPARILLAMADSPRRRAWFRLLHDGGHAPTTVETLEEARKALSGDEFHVALIDDAFDHDAGMRLARHLRRCQFSAAIVLVSAGASFDLAVEAMRLGVSDVVHDTVETEELLYRVECAALKGRQHQREERRMARLRDLCRRLNVDKQESSRQVEHLCQDLAHAYEDIADQISEVAMASEFRTLLAQELDLESLLRTTLEYMLTKTGPTNAAVFLPDADRQYALGAYVNYNCPREAADVLLNHVCDVVCPHMESEREIVRFDDADELAEWLGAEAEFLRGSQVVAFACMNGADCLAVMVLFRDAKDPFADDLPCVLEILRPIFARQVASVIRVHHRARPSWPKEAVDDAFDMDSDDDFGFSGGMAA